MSDKTQIPGFLWDEKGKIGGMPLDKICCVYHIRESTGRMSHTGLYIPPLGDDDDGFVIDARGHAYGVVKGALSNFSWTHYAYKEMTGEQAAVIRAWALERVGNPYIYGAYQRECTPAFRKNRAEQYAKLTSIVANIYKYCPVLSGKQATCSGCKYVNELAYDCAQFTRYAFVAAGLYLPSGANNQYHEWIPDDAHDIANAAILDVPDTLRRGSEGTDVKTLQELLDDNGASLQVDGIFGRLTRDAVITYQQENGLNVDGVVGRQTWGALLYPEGTNTDETVEEPEEGEEPTTIILWTATISDLTTQEAAEVQAEHPGATLTRQD